jgi:hypothetical protein
MATKKPIGTPPHSRGGIRPSFASSITPLKVRGRREGRVAAAPGAPAQKEFARAREPQVQAVTTGLPCAMVLRLIRALLGEPSCLPPSPPRCVSIVGSLAPDIWGARTTRLRRTQEIAARQSARSRPPHPRLTCRDDRDTSLCKRGGMHATTPNPNFGKQKYFCARGLTSVRPAARRANQLQARAMCNVVVPAKAGTHTAESNRGIWWQTIFARTTSCGYGSRLSPGRHRVWSASQFLPNLVGQISRSPLSCRMDRANGSRERAPDDRLSETHLCYD